MLNLSGTFQSLSRRCRSWTTRPRLGLRVEELEQRTVFATGILGSGISLPVLGQALPAVLSPAPSSPSLVNPVSQVLTGATSPVSTGPAAPALPAITAPAGGVANPSAGQVPLSNPAASAPLPTPASTPTAPLPATNVASSPGGLTNQTGTPTTTPAPLTTPAASGLVSEPAASAAPALTPTPQSGLAGPVNQPAAFTAPQSLSVPVTTGGLANPPVELVVVMGFTRTGVSPAEGVTPNSGAVSPPLVPDTSSATRTSLRPEPDHVDNAQDDGSIFPLEDADNGMKDDDTPTLPDQDDVSPADQAPRHEQIFDNTDLSAVAISPSAAALSFNTTAGDTLADQDEAALAVAGRLSVAARPAPALAELAAVLIGWSWWETSVKEVEPRTRRRVRV